MCKNTCVNLCIYAFCKHVCPSFTLKGCLENRSVKKTNSSKPKKDTSCLVPRWAVSRASQNTTATSTDIYIILKEKERGEVGEFREKNTQTLYKHYSMQCVFHVMCIILLYT